jgi:hypothetical protein
MAWSPEEVAKQLLDLGTFDPDDVPLLAQYLFAEYEGQREGIVNAHFETLAAQIRGEYSDDIIEQMTRLAETAADSLLESMSKADLNTVGEKIAEGIAEGLNPRDIARRLEEVQGLDSNRAKAFEKFRKELDETNMTPSQLANAEEREFQRLLRERRQTIARQESNMAVSEGDRLDALARGAQYKVWSTNQDDRVSDECQANEAQGPIPIDEAFAGGVDTTPQHVGCRCSVSYITGTDILPAVEQLAKESAEITAAAKESK